MIAPKLLSSLPADARNWRLAIGVGVISLAVFILLAPYASTPVGRLDAFIPAYQSALILTDLATAALLFGKWNVSRSRAVAILAAGYLFTAVITAGHTLTFPGLFAPQGLLGAGQQSTAWIYMFWHAIFPLFVIGYARTTKPQIDQRGTVGWALGAVALAAVFTGLATAGEAAMPAIMRGHGYASAYSAVVGVVWLTPLAALFVLARKRPKTVLDVWLMVVMWVWACDIGLSAVFNAGRFDLGFYAGRTFGLLAGSFLLWVLLFESVSMYRRMAAVNRAEVDIQIARESEARLRAMADAMPQIAFVRRPDGSVEFINQRWHEYTGLLTGEADELERVVHPEDLPEMMRRWKEALANSQALEFELRLRRASDGAYHWFLLREVPVKDETGGVFRWYGTATDINERKQAEQALQASDRRKDEFLAVLAHELRNPLGPIRNAIQILNVVAAHEPTARKARQVIDRQSGHMARLIDDLLDVARITHGKLEIKKARCDLVATVRDACEDYRPALEAAGLQLNIDIPNEPIWVYGDETRLNQIVGNVLHNSVKFTEAGGQIAVKVQCTAKGCEVNLRDTGIGMDEETLQRMFQSFNQADRSLDRSRGGLGLGLALVKHLVELHDGHIDASSAGVGRGSEITVVIPLEVTAAAPRQAGAAGVEEPRGPLRILVVEDNIDAAETLCVLLELKGHMTDKAHNGRAGLEACRSFKPHIVFCDIGLPGLDGYEVARALRREPESADVYLVALTGYGQQEDQRRTREAGFDLHLIKPVDDSALEMALAMNRASLEEGKSSRPTPRA